MTTSNLILTASSPTTSTPTPRITPPHKLSIQLPPHPHVHTWNRHLPSYNQAHCSEIPIFKDACYVREQVFVHEQQVVPLVHHLDPDDARSVHIVIYAPENSEPEDIISGDSRESFQSKYVPVGTIRILPYPDHARPLPNSSIVAPPPTTNEELLHSSIFFNLPPPAYESTVSSALHDGIEPYIRLGRLALLPSYRGRGYADLLIQAALKWASENPRFSYEMLREEEKKRVPEWRGLVCLHAREKAVETWGRNGFLVDEGMGTWWEYENTQTPIRCMALAHTINGIIQKTQLLPGSPSVNNIPPTIFRQ
ncbi:hypothetical protein EYC80_001837 [Monilinia laxa]|uniref:N-acetyltransferase domain-containing protein n=2 Tax=Monilinia laxa TaxID=61186 RepID=A0A5N6K6D1_MONLA|nr:hypothetical protein EYC80_001837 [Monilinia laxa]